MKACFPKALCFLATVVLAGAQPTPAPRPEPIKPLYADAAPICVVDGVIDDPIACTWDPKAFVGTAVGDEKFTEADAEVVRRIWEGPRGHGGRFIWHGMTRGTNLVALAETTGTPLRGKPFGIAHDWFKYFLVQDAKWSAATMTRDEFELLWNQSVEIYGPVFGADDPDLTRFRDRGGKLIITHGLADQLIPHLGSVDYFERVQQKMGGAQPTAQFARLFLIPGVDHGSRGAGPAPTGGALFDALVAWVEQGKAPESLRAELKDKDGKLVRTRPLFPYPQLSVYKGSGSTDDGANFESRTPGR